MDNFINNNFYQIKVFKKYNDYMTNKDDHSIYLE